MSLVGSKIYLFIMLTHDSIVAKLSLSLGFRPFSTPIISATFVYLKKNLIVFLLKTL